jgi:hypothetical protein
MRKKYTDYLGAFRQLWVMLTLLCWLAFVYFLITGESGSLLQVSRYGRASMGSANVFSSLIASLISSLLLIFLFVPSNSGKNKRKQ